MNTVDKIWSQTKPIKKILRLLKEKNMKNSITKMNYKKTMASRVTTLQRTCQRKKSLWQNGLAIKGPNHLSKFRVTVNLVQALPVVKRSQSSSLIFIIWECHPITLSAMVQRDRTPLWVQMLTNLTEISLHFQADIQIPLRKKVR